MMKMFLTIMIFIALASSLYADSNFMLSSFDEAKLLSSETDKPILLIFGANYCNHCAALKKDIQSSQLSQMTDKYIICYVDITENNDLKTEFGVSIVPDTRIINRGIQKHSIKGYNIQKYMLWLKNAK